MNLFGIYILTKKGLKEHKEEAAHYATLMSDKVIAKLLSRSNDLQLRYMDLLRKTKNGKGKQVQAGKP